jgi:hypothetical protein
MQEGTTSRTDFFSPRRREKLQSLPPTVLRMPRSLVVIYRPQGSHLAPSSFVHALTFAGQLPQFCGSPRIRPPQLPHTSLSSIPLLSAALSHSTTFFSLRSFHNSVQTTANLAQSSTVFLPPHHHFWVIALSDWLASNTSDRGATVYAALMEIRLVVLLGLLGMPAVRAPEGPCTNSPEDDAHDAYKLWTEPKGEYYAQVGRALTIAAGHKGLRIACRHLKRIC